MGHYRLYVALLQSPIDSPEFADVLEIPMCDWLCHCGTVN
jgi:hypothetical protein